MTQENDWRKAIAQLMDVCNAIANEHGWWDKERSDGEVIALIHSELSEALEALRAYPQEESEHIPRFLAIEEELADVLIRVFDFAQEKGYDLPGALLDKIQFNETREYRHGGKRF